MNASSSLNKPSPFPVTAANAMDSLTMPDKHTSLRLSARATAAKIDEALLKSMSLFNKENTPFHNAIAGRVTKLLEKAAELCDNELEGRPK